MKRAIKFEQNLDRIIVTSLWTCIFFLALALLSGCGDDERFVRNKCLDINGVEISCD
jgi:hypothetical protein